MRVILLLGLALLVAPAAQGQQIVTPAEAGSPAEAPAPAARVVEAPASHPTAEVRTEPAHVARDEAAAAANSPSAKTVFAIIGLVVVVVALVAFLS